ncbi:MAG TPA: serine/threonine-protein kinase [Polyangiaceae bacterium]
MTAAPTRLGPYELIERLATGGMAEVYLAKRVGPHGFAKQFAVKRILPQLASDSDFVAMFVDEARVTGRLVHPNIVSVFDFGEEGGELYMAMEYVDGTTGARLIRAAAAKNEDIPLEVSLHVALSVLRGLEYAHAAVDENGKPLALVHRDVSPGNVLIDRSGAVKLTDFGIARAAEFERRTDVGQLKGKLGYMSPEQVVGRELDARSDLFTLGIVLAEMVTVRPLFSGGRELDVLLRIRDADISAIDRNAGRVPDDVRSVLYRALAKDPAQRYPTASAFAGALEHVIRRRRLNVGPSRTAAYVEHLGLTQRGDAGEDEDTGDTGRHVTAVIPNALDVESSRLRSESERPTAPQEASRDVSPQVYRVRQDDGTELGPMSYPRLLELFATGRAGAKSAVARESGTFKLAENYPELGRFVASPALRWDDEPPRDAAVSGPLDRRALPSLVFGFTVARETGLLLVRDGARRKKVYLVEGAPEFVASTDKSELLGEHLIAQGQVLRMEVEMALAMLPRFGGRIGDALVGLGVLRPIELFRALHEQTKRRFLDIYKWKGGELAFVRGARSQEETFPLGVDPYELIARGVREGYDATELEHMLEPLAEQLLEAVALPPVRLEAFRLTDAETRVLRRIDGTFTVSRLVANGVADPEDVYRAVFIGLSCELIHASGWSG